MNVISGNVSESGRISIPADMRRELGLEHGGSVVLELVDHEIRIRTATAVVKQAQMLTRQLLAGKAEAGIDDLLAERKRETDV